MASKLVEQSKFLCPENILCKQIDCSLMHPRCFAGVCVNNLNGNCQIPCPKKLKHLKKGDLKGKLQMITINGVFVFNLCSNIGCIKENNICYYLHRDWIIKKNICVKYLQDNDDCEELCKNEQKHIDLEELRQKVLKEYEYNNLSPETIIDEEKHYKCLEKYCIKYFKGICDSKGQCSKIHIDWENIQYVSAQEFKSKKLIPCTLSQTPQIQRLDTKSFQKLEMFFEKSKLEQMKRNIKEQNMLDVVFIMDCTGSMQKWIDQAKESISSIIESFNQAVSETQIRIAFIGYRDFNDKNHIQYHDFTTDVQLIKQFISTLRAEGGQDSAEDVAGAIQQSLILNFSKHHKSILCTFLISDAPTHGKQYHNIQDDYYKDSIQEGSLEKIMQALDKKKIPNNYFFCCKLNDSTDIMYETMKKNFKNLQISQLQTQDFANYVSISMKHSYANSSINFSQISSSKKRFNAHFIWHKPIEPVECTDKNQMNYFSNFLTQMGKNQIGGDTILEIEMKKKQLSQNDQGQVSYIYEAFDIRNNLRIVIKIPKQYVDLYNKEQVNETILKDAQKASFVRYNQTLIAKQLSAAYRAQTKDNDKAPPIYYVTPIKYQLSSEFLGLKECYAETNITLEGPWEKISNNTSFINKEKENYSAFSHFTFHFTNKRLLITDLQGKGGVFADPCIHTAEKIEYLSDLTNLEQEGIQTFFQTQHSKCNQICQSLQLMRNEDNIIVPQTRTYLTMKPFNFEQINAVCIICGDLFQTTHENYKNNDDSSYTCQGCLQVNELSEICECCAEQFKFDLNKVLKLALDYKICEYCQKNCSNQLCQSCAQILQKQITFCDQCKKKKQCHYCQSKCMKRNLREKIINVNSEPRDLCEEAFIFFDNLYCFKCYESFTFKNWPSQEEYVKGEYLCYVCQNK
ncbi:unnamed protein product [Paramecium sonneborni]|uniref:Alpha-type protein kinase domain-containing protein n=1 Tax=Paramecium sonneborni TaxID=65129 RepID=A0A8S1QY34_9CILI|nr:unnamed protein product [Paramecium sonneborni]